MPKNLDHYNPRKETATLLDWCWMRLQTVPYSVTLRWLFYRFMQELLINKLGWKESEAKKQYEHFKVITARARYAFYNAWRPDTLVDDTRRVNYRGYGYNSGQEWMTHFLNEKCELEKYSTQDNIVEVWFEAEAMYTQFDYYTRSYHLTMRPFKGDPSLFYKYKAAKDLQALAKALNRPVKILYFGDWDWKGRQIPATVAIDANKWCAVDIELIRCGINEEHIKQFNILEKFDKESGEVKYQWEAITEQQAQSLIVNAIEKYWSLDKIREVEAKEAEYTKLWRPIAEKILHGVFEV